MSRRQLKVVKLIEPEMCMECRFARMASVEMKDGSVARMIHCARLDCDNWDYSNVQAANSVQVDDDD